MVKGACTVLFAGLLLLLSWCYRQSSFEERFDPIKAANEERDAVLKELDGAQRACAEMRTKHERAIETIVNLQDEATKNFKDLPYLNKMYYALSEEVTVKDNEIQHLKTIQQQYNDLLDNVSVYGTKQPDECQQECESLQRRLEISKCHLQKSKETAEALKDMLETQKETADRERDWLRAMLKKNARSSAYWAKFRRNDGSKLAWGVRCACTEPETAYSLKDQTPRIVELEGMIAARDETISRLRARRGNVRENDASSQPNATKTFLPSTPQPVKTTPVHSCEHEQQCKNLEKQVKDDAKTIRQLRKKCQDLRDATSSQSAADATVTDSQYLGESGTKDAMITELQEEKTKTREELATKDKEIDDLRAEKSSAEKNAATQISDLDQKLSDSRKDLEDVREIATERETELGRQKTRISDLEANQRQLKDTIKQKDLEIEELEDANQEIAAEPAPESAETLQRLTTANTNLEDLRHQHAKCKGQSETQSARINELEVTQRGLEGTIEQKNAEIKTANTNLEESRNQHAGCKGQSETQSARINDLLATMTLKDNRIATLEEQIRTAPSTDLIEHQNQTHTEAISRKDDEYRVLQNLYNAKSQEHENLWTEARNFHSAHLNCDRRLQDLANRLRQGSSAHTDLQIKHNTQAKDLETAKQDADELRSRVAALQQANSTLEQKTSCSASEAEKYRVEGEDRVRPRWQEDFIRETSALRQQLETSQGKAFKLENELQKAKTQASPLREMQLKSREDAVKAREDAVNQDADDVMDHDQLDGSKVEEQREVKSLQAKLGAANKEVGDGRLRINNFQRQLNKEKKDRKEDKERHERELKREKEEFENKSKVLKLRLEAENPLKGTVSKLQNEITVLKSARGGRR